MREKCAWCGKLLQIKRGIVKENIREVCASCGYKIREYPKPMEKPKEPEKPSPVEVMEHEKPIVKEKPIWPWIVGAIILVLILIVLVRVLLL
ncbi:MAG: hypothetical protein ABH817_02300 [archaeon]